MVKPHQRLGRYAVLGLLGEGGLGAVYRARDPQTGDAVAVKVLASRAASPRQRERFLREIEALSQLRHPGLIEILDAGEQEGRPWFAMPLVAGGSLEGRLRERGPLHSEEVIELGLQLCDALAHAHSQGILHRDLKPDNVLCAPRGRYVVLDFGLTKDVVREARERLSLTGGLQGTPGYWAPEQARGAGGGATQSVDVYGLGAVLYAALTGFPPIQGQDLVAISVGTLEHDPIPPREHVEGVPPALEELILRCLRKDPAERPASLRALEGELRALSDSTLPQAPAPERHPLALPLLVGGLVCLFATGGLALALMRSEAPARAPSPQVSAPAPSVSPTPLGPPAWFTALAPEERPPLPLPAGISFAARGEYLNEQDRSVLVWVPPGSFRMGGARTPDEEPRHHVRIRAGFFLAKYEVSWEQFDRYCDARQLARRDRTMNYNGGSEVASDRHPAHGVSWDDAKSYCEWAGLRLPTEAEWEFAARGPELREWPWGAEAPSREHFNALDRAVTWTLTGKQSRAAWNDGYSMTAPVDAFPRGAAACGALNMLGNVKEWVQDTYLESYAGAPQDGSAVEGGRYSKRGARGGSFDMTPEGWHTTARAGHTPVDSRPTCGLRPAR